MNIFIIQTTIMVLLTIIIFYLVIYNKSLKIEKRISKYSVDSIKDNSISLFDMMHNKYFTYVSKMSKILKKSHFFTKYSNKYNRYITYENDKDTIAMDYVSHKIYISIFFVLTISFARIVEGKIPSIIDITISFLLGFFSVDIYFKIYDIIRRKKVEQDLLNAIVIMNNAFRSGMSMMQAIKTVSEELTGPIAQEFKKMYLEINYGLSLDVVFDRFSKRVNSDEVSYITSSLSILNKTGGNIINVFSSIESMLFSKRKLQEEMKSLTSSANMVSKILLIMPIVFVILISLLNPSYFMPLINTTLGNILLTIILLIYMVYALIVNKIMKVRFN